MDSLLFAKVLLLVAASMYPSSTKIYPNYKFIIKKCYKRLPQRKKNKCYVTRIKNIILVSI